MSFFGYILEILINSDALSQSHMSEDGQFCYTLVDMNKRSFRLCQAFSHYICKMYLLIGCINLIAM